MGTALTATKPYCRRIRSVLHPALHPNCCWRYWKGGIEDTAFQLCRTRIKSLYNLTNLTTRELHVSGIADWYRLLLHTNLTSFCNCGKQSVRLNSHCYSAETFIRWFQESLFLYDNGICSRRLFCPAMRYWFGIQSKAGSIFICFHHLHLCFQLRICGLFVSTVCWLSSRQW